MPRTNRFLIELLALVLCNLTFVQSAEKPNIVFVLADDLGWSELSCYGNDFNETPNLDRLAKEGQRFTDAYAAAPVCSPYRAAFLTGLYPARIGITDYLRPNSANALSAKLPSLPRILKRHGYATGMIGKWHLTGYRHHGAEFEARPQDFGFDWNIGSEVKSVGNGSNTWPYVFRDQKIQWIDLPNNKLGNKEYLTDRLNVEAVEFIERNKNKPFFLYLSHYAPHTILNGRADLVSKYVKKHAPGKSTRNHCYLCEDAGLGKGDPQHHWAGDHNPHLAAMLESIDQGIGKIRAKLDSLGLLENTIFIFSSDNGGETNVTSNQPFRGGKSQLYEGGIRVPLIVSWPAQMPSSKLNRVATMNLDFVPTLLDAAGINEDLAGDGVSMLKSWKEPGASSQDSREFYWHYPLDQPHFLGGFSGGAIRSGDWKLIEFFDSGKNELYNLAEDPGEDLNVAKQSPEVVLSLAKKLKKWRQSIAARRPSPPLLTQPRQLYFADHFSNMASERLWYNKDWVAEEGVLRRIKTGSANTRIFLRDAKYRDVLIRFDFRFLNSKDIRLVTGSNGPYNAVVHIRPDHFFVQTAMDKTGPYFSYRHDECAFQFQRDRWYTMTIEFLGDRLLAHLDHEHLVMAIHPILDKERTYFALQVDQHEAEFDNIQILHAGKHKEFDKNQNQLKAKRNAHPVTKSLEESFRIRKTNAHEWFYQRSKEYRLLVKKVDDLDDRKKQLYPAAFRSHKDVRKSIQGKRKTLLQEDAKYKELLFAMYRAEREIESFLISKKPEIKQWPNSRRKAELERLRKLNTQTAEYFVLDFYRELAQRKLESTYPELFISDEQINNNKKKAYDALRQDPMFRELVEARAAAWREQEAFLFDNDDLLADLKRQLKQ